MRKLLFLFFSLVFILLLFFGLGRNLFSSSTLVSDSQIVVPTIEDDENPFLYSDATFSSFIELQSDEVLLGTIEFDVDDDGFEDQVNIIKNTASLYILLVVALYNTETANFERSLSMPTVVSQLKTFSCTNLDVIGNHKNALIYQGVDDSGNVVLKMYVGSRAADGTLTLNAIGDFVTDGSVFIQQNPRNDAYELSQERGESFPVWVYTSGADSAVGAAGADQIQMMYDWSATDGRYVLVRTNRVAAQSLVAKELAQIQDGTVASFSKFLDGLWYKTVNTNEVRYIFFDYANSEIIFQDDDSEEVYSWLKSNLRRNGMYFSAVNKTIENLQRRFDISLVSVNEININIQDDVRMVIGETNLWDGGYKKVTTRTVEKPEADFECVDSLAEAEVWSSPDGLSYKFLEDSYEITGENVHDFGRYLKTEINGTALLQFRSESGTAYLSGTYLPKYYSVRTDAAFAEPVADDKDLVALQSIIISPEGYYQEQVQPIVLRRGAAQVAAADEPEPEDPGVNSVAVSEPADSKGPALSVMITPQYFSPDGDGEYDELFVQLKAESAAGVKNWSFIVRDPESRREFWSVRGQQDVTGRLVWDGKSTRGELVQSAMDYPYIFSVTDVNGNTTEVEGLVQVDILVIREGAKLKMQVPSIIFRSDAADFRSNAEVQSDPNWDNASRGLDQATIDNNIRVLSRISEVLKKFPDYSVTIEGNANNLSGTDAEEREVQLLSEERAKFVRNWLIQRGIAAGRLSAVGNGSKNPATTSTALADRWKNRRVEFILQK